VLIALLFVFCVFVWTKAFAQTASGVLTFAVLDVGQGDALYIESPTGVQVLIDAGQDGAVLRELADVMPWGDRSIDAVMATHPDADPHANPTTHQSP
jgi:beta-lactamase superfamily II metal-dependent hydrolase